MPAAAAAGAGAAAAKKLASFNPKCLCVVTNEYGLVVALQFFQHKGALCEYSKMMHKQIAARCPNVVSLAVDNAPACEQFYVHECYCDAKLIQDLLHAQNRISECLQNQAPAYSEALLHLKRCYRYPDPHDVGLCSGWAVRMATDEAFVGEICGKKFRVGEAMGETAAWQWINETQNYKFSSRGERSGGAFWTEFDGNIRFRFYAPAEIDKNLRAFDTTVSMIDAKYQTSCKTWTDAAAAACTTQAAKAKYLIAVGDPWILLKQRTLARPDVPLYLSAGGTSHTEAFNLVVDKPVASNNTGGALATALIIDRTVHFNDSKKRRYELEGTYFHHNRRLAEQVNASRLARGRAPKYKDLLPLREFDPEEVVVSRESFAAYRQPEPVAYRGRWVPPPAGALAAPAAAPTASASAPPPPKKKRPNLSRDATNAARSVGCSTGCEAKLAARLMVQGAVGFRHLPACPKAVYIAKWKVENAHQYE